MDEECSFPNITESSDSPVCEPSQKDFVVALFGVGLPAVLCCVGGLGNILSCFVLSRMARQSRSPLYVILTGMAFIDALLLAVFFLMNVLPNMFSYVNMKLFVGPFYYLGYLVLIGYPITMTLQTISIYISVLVSYERYTAVCRPMHANATRSRKSSAMSMSLLYLLCILYNLPRCFEFLVEKMPSPLGLDEIHLHTFYQWLWSNSVEVGFHNTSSLLYQNANPCVFLFRRSEFSSGVGYKIYSSFLYTFFLFLIPVSIITWTNGRLVCAIHRRQAAWRVGTRIQRKELKLTTVSLVIVLLSYVLALPAVILSILDSFGACISDVAITIANFCIVLNSTVNIVVYCFLGERFRVYLLQLCFIRVAMTPSSYSHQSSLLRRHSTRKAPPIVKDWETENSLSGTNTNFNISSRDEKLQTINVETTL